MIFCILSCVLIFEAIYCNNTRFVHNELNDDMSDEFEGLVIHYTNENKSWQNISDKLIDVFNKEYGNGWQCLITKDVMAFHLDSQPGTKSWLIHNNINFILFKQKLIEVNNIINFKM